nr:LysR substrate-binding domain-containing protein [Marinicella sp. W31]MDC2876995.1 LysR substrate-binding domain-containing protein [Marinicella sp. W31]
MLSWFAAPNSDIEPQIALQTDHYELLFRTTRESNAITGAPGHLLVPYLADNSLVALDYTGPVLNWSAKAIYRHTSTLSPAFSELVKLIETYFQQISGTAEPVPEV